MSCLQLHSVNKYTPRSKTDPIYYLHVLINPKNDSLDQRGGIRTHIFYCKQSSLLSVKNKKDSLPVMITITYKYKQHLTDMKKVTTRLITAIRADITDESSLTV